MMNFNHFNWQIWLKCIQSWTNATISGIYNYFKLFDDLPDDLVILSGPQSEMADFIHLFCVSLDELKSAFAKYKPALKKTGMLWISWPKGGVPIATDLKRDPIREHLLANGLVDIKVAAVDDTWSGLKFMYRVKDR